MLPGFVAFDTYKTLLQDEFGKISGPRTVIAGFGAGITESLFAVTPFESIKTTLCVLARTHKGTLESWRVLREQNRWPEISQSPYAWLPAWFRHNISGTRRKRFLPRIRSDHCSASGKFSDKIWKLYNYKAVCSGLRCTGREARHSEHIRDRWFGRFDYCVSSQKLLRLHQYWHYSDMSHSL